MVLAYLRTHAERLKSLDPLVRRDEPDAVHQMRVATRRLRSTLRTFERIVCSDGTRRLAAELKWLGTVLGAARDCEVLAGHLRAALAEIPTELVIGPVQARVQGHYAPVCADARAELLAALDSARYFSLLDALDALTADPPLTTRAGLPAARALPAAARRPYRQARRRMRRARQARPGQPRDTALHEVRGAERELGISAHLAGENAFSYGLLHGRDACDAERLQTQARRTWKRASRARYRRWMR